ncbi:MAG: Asp-tRNA(Asn)/Glu-tRNA(Gln) amidotransferase subunit GatB [Planctomycetota bacterium]
MTTDVPPKDFELIIGLEIHVQLQTKTKLFCGCSTIFGGAPNSQTCHICTGMPGALPVLNERALHLAIKTGLALNCKIEQQTKWDRKNYFYPDLPKGYQISQLDRPICYDGHVDLVDNKGVPTGEQVRIERAHLEEDAGKSTHDESGAGRDSKIDLNRAGTPLLEIVTKPDLRNAEDARNFLNELKLILTYVEASDCNMQQGNLRVDANVNLLVDKQNDVATPIVEIKNLNSFRAVERAIQFESERQKQQFIESGQTKADAPKQTRGWNDEKQATVLQREKEESADYRYFPDPDLVAVETSTQEILDIQAEIGTLPAELRKKLIHQKLSEYDADVLVRQGRAGIKFYEQLLANVGNPKLVSNWIQQEVLRYLNDSELPIEKYPVAVEQFGKLLKEVEAKKIDQNRAKEVLQVLLDGKSTYAEAKQTLGIVEVDDFEINRICQKIITANPEAAEDFRSGNGKAIGALIGQARKENPNANPGLVRQQLIKILDLK